MTIYEHDHVSAAVNSGSTWPTTKPHQAVTHSNMAHNIATT